MAKKAILFIEDDLPTIEVYKTALEAAGFDVDPLLLGEEAIRRMEEIDKGEAKKPDLVLLDIILPDMNGIKVLEKIRKYKKTKDMKVLILSNYTNKELEERGLFLEAEKYVLKANCPPSELVKLVRKELK